MEQEESNLANDKYVFVQRTVAKTFQTKLITCTGNLLKNKPNADDVKNNISKLEEAIREIIELHTNYTSRLNLLEEETVATTTWLNDVQESNEGCLNRMKGYLSAIDQNSFQKENIASGQWNVIQHRSLADVSAT
jgi:arsenate reductase-like glutaredoxin family protein